MKKGGKDQENKKKRTDREKLDGERGDGGVGMCCKGTLEGWELTQEKLKVVNH